MERAVRPPALSRTTSVFESRNLASPRNSVMLGLSAMRASYLTARSSSTLACCCARRALRSTFAAAADKPASKGLPARRCVTCAARIMILDGTQPTLTQVPPMVPRSMSVTRAPRSADVMAAAIAAPPVPMTAIRSTRSAARAFTKGARGAKRLADDRIRTGGLAGAVGAGHAGDESAHFATASLAVAG